MTSKNTPVFSLSSSNTTNPSAYSKPNSSKSSSIVIGRLRRIQTLEYALYAHGEEQFADAFVECSELECHSKIVLQTHLTYEKQLRNLHIQGARIDRKRTKALAELRQLQSERMNQSGDHQEEEVSGIAPFASEAEFFAALNAGYVPPQLAAPLAQQKQVNENGFEFSNQTTDTSSLTEPCA